MKKNVIYILLLLGSILADFTSAAQDTPAVPESFDVTVRLFNKKGKPYKGAGTIVHIKGSNDFHGTSAEGIVVIPGVIPEDTISILSSVAIFDLPVMGMDSINVIMRNSRKIDGFYHKNESELLNYGYLTVNRRANSGPTRSMDMSDAGNYS